MNEKYKEVREELRKQHAQNVNEVYGKGSRGSLYYAVSNETAQPDGFRIGFQLKVLCLLGVIMLCSLYIYGDRDVKKGTDMAWRELTETVEQLEEREPLVKETISYCKKGYWTVKDVVEKAYFSE